MAFPVIQSTTSSSETTDVAGPPYDHTVNLPATINSGDLLLAVFNIDGTSGITWPGDWTVVDSIASSDLNRMSCYYRVASGSEGSSITITTGAAQESTAVVFRITGHDSSTNPPEYDQEDTQDATPASSTPDPGLLTPTGGSKDYLWIAVSGCDHGDSDYTGYPSGYTGTGKINSGGSTGVALAWGYKNATASSENPGNFTLDTAREWVCYTLAVHPGSEGSAGTVGSLVGRSSILLSGLIG